MAYRPTRRQWVKLWVNEWLDGTTRYQLTDAQRAFWVDLLALAGRSRYPGIIASGKDGKKWVGYPLNEYQARAPSIDILPTLRLLEKTQKIRIQKTGIRLKQPLFKIEIVNWDKYQSEYLRQKPYRKADTDKVTTKVHREEEVEGDKEVEGEGEEEKRGASRPIVVHYDLVSIWNLSSGSLPKIRQLTSKRYRKVQTLIKTHAHDQEAFIDSWRGAVIKAGRTPFCRGENSTGWRVTFDWMIANDTNYVKVLEGNYDDSGKRTGNKAQQRQVGNLEEARRAISGGGPGAGDIRRALPAADHSRTNRDLPDGSGS